MTQSEFESALAESLGDVGIQNGSGNPVTKRDVRDILEILGGEIEAHIGNSMPSVSRMSQGEKPPSLTVRGVGRFSVRFRKAKPKRMGRNPATGEDIQIAAKPASRKLVVTPLRTLKESLGVD